MNLFLSIKKTIEFLVNLPLRYHVRRRSQNDRTWLMLSPQYLNYGDQLIALAELDYMAKKGTVVDVNFSYFDIWGSTLTTRIRKGDIIWITGGGFIGDLWPQSHAAVEKIIRMFPDNRIVFAPQTVYFADMESQNAKNFSELVCKHGKIVFFAREKNTIRILELLHIQSKLTPDFALFSDCAPRRDFFPEYVSFCLRDDHESRLTPEVRSTLECGLKKYGKPFHDIVMAKQHCEIPTWTRRFFVENKIDEYARSVLVVTDRLHGMLFCCISGVPCVALDNKSKKVSGVYDWIKELPYITFADSIVDVELAAAIVMQYPDSKENRKEFHRIREQLMDQFKDVFDEYIV